MRNLLTKCEPLIVWASFMVTTVYGHVAFKMAAGQSDRYDYKRVLLAFQSVWVWTALAAWLASAVLWFVLLTKHGLGEANSISAIRYVCICVAAWFFFGGSVTPRDLLGTAFVTVGIWLLAQTH